jgi:hypothetical protein
LKKTKETVMVPNKIALDYYYLKNETPKVIVSLNVMQMVYDICILFSVAPSKVKAKFKIFAIP